MPVCCCSVCVCVCVYVCMCVGRRHPRAAWPAVGGGRFHGPWFHHVKVWDKLGIVCPLVGLPPTRGKYPRHSVVLPTPHRDVGNARDFCFSRFLALRAPTLAVFLCHHLRWRMLQSPLAKLFSGIRCCMRILMDGLRQASHWLRCGLVRSHPSGGQDCFACNSMFRSFMGYAAC